jgi:hypothetical protein
LSLHGLGSSAEPELMAGYRAASALWDKQPDEARKKIVELVEKNPHTNTAAMATLKLKITSQPDGANVTLNGKPSGSTPVTLDVSAMGITRVALTKEGFRGEEIVKSNVREDAFAVVLDRVPSAATLLFAPPTGGIFPAPDNLVMGIGRDLVLCSRDLKVNTRVRLNGPTPSGTIAPPPVSAARGEAFMTEAGSTILYRLDMASNNMRQIELEQPATSTPVLFNSPETPPVPLIVVATRNGFESFKDEDGQSHKRVALGKDAVPPPGLAFDGERFYLPRPGGHLIAVNGVDGLKTWEANAGAEISGPPAYHPAAKVVAIASTGGRVSAFDPAGVEKWKQELKEDCPFGVQLLGGGFVAVQKSGKIQALAGDTGAPGWSTQLTGSPVLPPVFVRPNNRDKAFAVCSREGEGAAAKFYLTLLSADKGEILWRKTLEAAPAALAADDQRLYIATADSMLQAFDVK